MAAEQGIFKIMVLVAEDDAGARELIAAFLALKQYMVIEVTDGNQMVEKARQDPPNLIISDIMMPRLDGFEGIQRLREDPRFDKIPVLFISGVVSGEAIVNKIKSMPKCSFLPKPFNHHTLLKAVDQLLKTT